MTILNLTLDHIFRLTADPALYAAVPFLTAMQEPALSLHAKVKKTCRPCNPRPANEAKKQLASAFTSLVRTNSQTVPNELPQLRDAALAILKTTADQLVLDYVDGAGHKAQLTF